MITRRQFLGSSLTGFLSVCFGASFAANSSLYEGKSIPENPVARVVVIVSSKAFIGRRINQDAVKIMMNTGITLLVDSGDVGKAWNKIFLRGDVIALKVNPIARNTGSTKPEVCFALAETIHENVGVPYDNFIIFDVSQDDLKEAGFPINRGKKRIQIVATEKYSDLISCRGVKAKISNIITDRCSALVNIPLLKTHIASGLTVSLKNHYGSIPREMVRDDSLRYHMDEFKNVVYLNLMPPIREKTRLIVVDGLRAQYHLGPGGDRRFQWNFNGIIMGTDPVAVDTVCLSIINNKRAQNAMETISVPYLDWARQEGLGTNLLKEILVYEKTI